MKRFDDEESDDAGGCDAQAGFPPEQRVTGNEAKVSEVPG